MERCAWRGKKTNSLGSLRRGKSGCSLERDRAKGGKEIMSKESLMTTWIGMARWDDREGNKLIYTKHIQFTSRAFFFNKS